MGNVSSRSSKEEKKAERPAKNQPEPPKHGNDSAEQKLNIRESLRRARDVVQIRRSFSKALVAIQRGRSVFTTKVVAQDSDNSPDSNKTQNVEELDDDDIPLSGLRQRILARQREVQASIQPNMDEIIYIPDDDEPVGRRGSRSSTSSEVEYISVQQPRRRRTEQDNHGDAAHDETIINASGSEVQERSQTSGNFGDAEAFMDDLTFDWTQFVNDHEPAGAAAATANNYIMNTDMDPGAFFGYDPGNMANPDLVADPLICREACIDEIVTVFPDICREYVSELYDNGDSGKLSAQIIARILDNVEKGNNYPKAKERKKNLKRKRERNSEEEEEQTFASVDRESGSPDYKILTQQMLQGEFSDTPMTFVNATLAQTKGLLFPAYRILEEAERTWDHDEPPYNRIKTRRKLNPYYSANAADQALASEATTTALREALLELQAARRVRRRAAEKRDAERLAELAEAENIRNAMVEGTMLDCGCCFDMFPMNRMVHCENDEMHWFCRNCAKQTAEHEIGNQKYQINCMSMDGCAASFSQSQKAIFLDQKTLIALDRNEQEAMLRLAGIENLESCPFCPFAAEYPPIDENKEFHCQAEDCEKVSCRLCRLESHIPKTCEESAKDNGLSLRRQIEEAMSAALIRKCNKCETPFVKEEGCNKMTCTRAGCRNVQCYVCSKSCNYGHFNDSSRGGKPGNCPLFESVEERHQQEVSKAQKEAMDKVRAEHPEYSEEDLKIKISDKVKQDEERRRGKDPRNPARAGLAVGIHGGHHQVMLGPEVFFPNPLPAEAGPSDAQIHAMQQEIQEHEDYFRNRNRREPEENIDLMLGLVNNEYEIPDRHNHEWDMVPLDPLNPSNNARGIVNLAQMGQQDAERRRDFGVQPVMRPPSNQQLDNLARSAVFHPLQPGPVPLQQHPRDLRTVYDQVELHQVRQPQFEANQHQREVQLLAYQARREQLEQQQERLQQARMVPFQFPPYGPVGHHRTVHQDQVAQERRARARGGVFLGQGVPAPAMPERPR